jgi:HSP20 family protein
VNNGVLRLSIPVAEKAKRRRIKIASSDEKRSINA